MNTPQTDPAAMPSAASAAPTNSALTSKVSELACVCMGLGMAPPEFNFIRNRQVMQAVFELLNDAFYSVVLTF